MLRLHDRLLYRLRRSQRSVLHLLLKLKMLLEYLQILYVLYALLVLVLRRQVSVDRWSYELTLVEVLLPILDLKYGGHL